MAKIKLSVVCVAYNHAKFIRQTLDGFVMQKTNFAFEVIIHDDASTDGTADIIREYAEKYPEIIKPILQTENQYSQGKPVTQNFIWPRINSQYVAVCDGDDYWTDENKLQKQVDFLDDHPDYMLCFHPVNVFYENGQKQEHIWPKHTKDISFKRLMRTNFIPNCAVVYRWANMLTEKFPKKIYPGDWFVHLKHAKDGKIGFIPDVMANYRRHEAGMSFADTQSRDALHKQWGIQELNFYLAVEKQIAPNPSEYHTFVCQRAREFLGVYIQADMYDKAVEIIKICPDMLSYEINMQNKKIKKYKQLIKYITIATGIICTILTIGLII